MIARCLLAGLLVCLLASPTLARPGTVHTKDGRTIEGDITDKGADGVTISTRAGQITIAAGEVSSVEYAGNIREAYEKRVAALPKNAGARTHYDIARWLYDNKEYELARKELDTALALDPSFEDAALLRQTVDRTMLLEKSKPNPVVRPATNATTRTAGGGPIKERHLLNADQINRIRQAELRNDDRVRVKLEKDVVKKYVEMNNLDMRQFATLPDGVKALEILKNGTKDMRENVKIVSDPIAILEYKSKVQPALLQGCATTACHGGSAAGRFVLYAPADNDAISYTNFYILNRFKQTVTISAKETKDLRAIDRVYPSNSLILQYGLTRDRAEYDHPEVAGWTHIYRAGTQDPKYQQVFDWIRNVLIPVEPDYGFEFPLPGQPATTQPANQPKPPAAEPQPKAKENNAAGQNANANSADNNKSRDRDEKLDDARGRIKPINPGALPVPSIGTIPF